MRTNLCLGLAFLSAPVFGQAVVEDAAADKVFAQLESRWAKAVDDLRVPGMAVVVVRGDRVLFRKAFGTRDGERPVTEQSAFYIASATKPFVALAIMQLVEAGKVELDAPVKRYLPRFKVADAKVTEELTVRELLSHAPGINSGPIVTLDAFTGEITEDRYYRFLAGVKPTGKVDYSNVHYTLAGRIIEAVTKKGWRDYLAENVFAPAGMDHATGYADAMYARDDVALPMLPGAETPTPCQRKTDRTMHAAGGLGTSIRDLERWLIVQLNDGAVGDARLLSKDGMWEYHDLQSELGEPNGKVRRITGFALGWQYGDVSRSALPPTRRWLHRRRGTRVVLARGRSRGRGRREHQRHRSRADPSRVDRRLRPVAGHRWTRFLTRVRKASRELRRRLGQGAADDREPGGRRRLVGAGERLRRRLRQR